MKPETKHVYEVWVGLSGATFRFESSRPLERGDRVSRGGKRFYVAYVVEREVPTIVAVSERAYRGPRNDAPLADGDARPAVRLVERRAANDDLVVIRDARAALTALPEKPRAELIADVRRLMNFWSPRTERGAEDDGQRTT